MPSQPVIGPGQPFLLEATAFDPDALPLPMQYLWQQMAGPDTALFNDVTFLEPTVVCSSLGDYTFRLSATDGVAIVSSDITVHITNVYRAAASYTAYCGSGSNGMPVTIVANYASAISPEDAYAEALALATAQAQAALVCVGNLAPSVAFFGTTPSISAVTTYTAACTPPYVGTPVTVTYTFTGVGRSYPAIESSSLTVATATANKALTCSRGNLAPVLNLIGFDFAVAATATATARCSDLFTPPLNFSSAVPVNTASDHPYTFGIEFSVSVSGTLNAVSLYKTGTEAGVSSHAVGVWDPGGVLLASATSSGEATGAGWATVNFTTPVSLTPGLHYTAAYQLGTANYRYQSGAFTSPVTSGPITVYRSRSVQTTTLTYPTLPSSSSYGTDILFTPSASAPTYGPPVSLAATVTRKNMTYEAVEREAYLTARAQALAALVCSSNIAPAITIAGWTASITATVTVVRICPYGQKGPPQLVTKSFSANDYAYAETVALTAAYAEASAGLVCVNNIPPEVFIVTAADLVYRCAVPYRNINYYRSAASINADFVYFATSTVAARCPAGTYGKGAYATVTASSYLSYADAEAQAILQAQAAAQAALQCTPYSGRIAFHTFNANAKFAPGDSQVLGVFRLTSGTPAAPARMRFLGVYPVPATFQNRFTDNLFYLSQFNDVLSGNWSYVFYLGRPHADGSYVWIPDSVRLRLDSAYPASVASIVSLSPAPNAGILSAAEGVLSLAGIEAVFSLSLSFAEAPYLALDPAGWCESGASYSGVYVFQTDAAVSTVLASGLVNLSPSTPNAYTEKTVLPLPFVPVITDRLAPLTFLFYFASANPANLPLGYDLNAGWPVGPPNSTAPFAVTDVSAVAWTNAGANNLSPYTVGSLASAKAVTLPGGAGSVTLPAASSHLATFAQTQDLKVILRRYRQRLF